MIKVLKLSNKSVSRFSTNKKWSYSSRVGGSIILEQGDDIPLFIDSHYKLTTEQNLSEFDLNIRVGKKISGTFFSSDSKYYNEDKEPKNYDGSYQRIVYNSIKHLFYNDYGKVGDSRYDEQYKNPLNIFGAETGQFTSLDYNSNILESTLNLERRILKNEVTVLEIPTDVFGEKIKPGSLRITDYSSPYDAIEIIDDGNTNLIIGNKTFNKISELNLNNNLTNISETKSLDNKLNVDYSDLTFGYSVDSYGDYMISGAPVLPTSPSELQTGTAILYKYNYDFKEYKEIKKFYSPFTQSGLAQETANDNCQFLMTEMGDIITDEDANINDNFGKTVSINDDICAIGSPNSHISGVSSEQQTGHIFIYEKNKGGSENWGLINVFEGTADSEFGNSISIDRDFIAVGSPNFDNGTGCVYIFKKTRRTKKHPWIKTSSVYETYKWNDVLRQYDGVPPNNEDVYIDYLKNKDIIISRKIDRIVKKLNELKLQGEITEEEYINNTPTRNDFSQTYPFNYLYKNTDTECTEQDGLWYKMKRWNENVHPSLKCKKSNKLNLNESVWPGYILDEYSDTYIPNPEHEQNKNNKWAYRWKLQNVRGNSEPINIIDENECDQVEIGLFDEEVLNSFGDGSNHPMIEYSESPDSSVGDVTYDLVGTILCPDPNVKRFGDKVSLKNDNIYISNHTSSDPKCFMFSKEMNEFGCEVWKLKNTISENYIVGHSDIKKLDENINSITVNYFDTYVEIDICPNTSNYKEWRYKFNSPILDQSDNISSSSGTKKCSAELCDIKYPYSSTFKRLDGKISGQIPANYGDSVKIDYSIMEEPSKYKLDHNSRFYSKSRLSDSYYHGSDTNITGLSWRNFRENVSFSYPNVSAGNQPCFMSIYWNDAKLDDGKYDPLGIIAEIGAQETMNGESVRLILNVGQGESEHFYEFIYRGSIEGTHFTINELRKEYEYSCILPPNKGSYVDLSKEDAFTDPLKNKKYAKLFSKAENEMSYVESWMDELSMAISWKNFRENVSFSYPRVDSGTTPSFMTIYLNEAKNYDGSYNPLYVLAEIGAQETLNGKKVRLTLNTGFVGGDEYYYEFVFHGSVEGTHYTLNELKENFDYDCTLPSNQGSCVKISDTKFNDPLNNKENARFYSKSENELSYSESGTDFDKIAISWKNFRENVSFSYPNVDSGSIPAFMTIYSNEAKQEDGTYNPLYTLAEIGASDLLNGEEVRLTFNSGFVGGEEYYYEFIYRGSIEGTHFTLNELRTEYPNDYAELKANQGDVRYIKDSPNLDIHRRCRKPKFFSKYQNELSYVEPYSSDDTIALSWKNFRENISFSYPNIKAGNKPSFMTIYSNNAKTENGDYDPLYTLAEIGATDALNGKIVKLIINSDNCKNDETVYYEFKYNGSIEGTHYLLNELKLEYDYECNLPPNSGTFVKIEDSETNEIKRFYSKDKHGLSYTETSDSDDTMAISWKNFRENVSFSYPNVTKGNQPCFMSIYENGAKKSDGNYDPIKLIGEIGAQETLNGKKVRLTFNTGFVGGDEYYYDFIFKGSIKGTHYTLNELIKENDKYKFVLPSNLGNGVPLNESKTNLFFSKGTNEGAYIDPLSPTESISITWKNFRENVSFSYPDVKMGSFPISMTIYSNDAKDEFGNYDPKKCIAEIGAYETLNDKDVKLTINSQSIGGDEYYYEFKYMGSINGTHFTLNELKDEFDYECTLLPNQGEFVSLDSIEFDDFLLNNKKAKFYTKSKNELSYVDSTNLNSNDDDIAISWKNVRENVSFSYPSIKGGNTPVFMTIYSDSAKDKNGRYNPIYTLAEIGATETLNGKIVKLSFNVGSVDDSEFFYEFKFNGSLEGNHYTLKELSERGILVSINDYNPIKLKYPNEIKYTKSEKIKPKKIEFVKKKFRKKIEKKLEELITKVKSYGEISKNYGEYLEKDKIIDDTIRNKLKSKFYYRKKGQDYHIQNSGIDNEIKINNVLVREDVIINYPTIREDGDTEVLMSIYSNHAHELNEYNEDYLLARVGANQRLNGEIIRLTLNPSTKYESFYEFRFYGNEIGTHFTLDELETMQIIDSNFPFVDGEQKILSVYSPEIPSCKLKIDKNSQGFYRGLHRIYILLIDNFGEPVGSESVIEVYNNPIFYDNVLREESVNKSYVYLSDIKSEFGHGLDASDDYLVIGNPSDRRYYMSSSTRNIYDAGSAFVFKIKNSELTFLKKIYGETEVEHNFNSRFGTDVSLLGNSFVVGSPCSDMSDMQLIDEGNSKRLEIEDFEFGTDRYTDETYNTRTALIVFPQDYSVEMNSEIGDAVIRIKIGSLNIDRNMLGEIDINAEFIDTGVNTLRVDGLRKEQLKKFNGTYELVKSPIYVKDGCLKETPKSNEVFLNKNNCSIYFDTFRNSWVITDTPNISVEYVDPENWSHILVEFEKINKIEKYQILNTNNIEKSLKLYNSNFKETSELWKSRIQKIFPQVQILYVDFIRELESSVQLKLSNKNIEKLFSLYGVFSRKRLDIKILEKWLDADNKGSSILPFIYELDSVNPIYLNFDLAKRTLVELYKIYDEDIIKSWSMRLGYKYILEDLLSEIRPNYTEELTIKNLKILNDIASDFIYTKTYNESFKETNKNYFKLTSKELSNYIQKWKSKVDLGFILSDVYKDVSQNVNVNFSISPESSYLDKPTQFINGVGTLEDLDLKISSNNDTTISEDSLTWGIYRDKTEIVGNELWVHVNLKSNVITDSSFSENIVLIFNSVKNGINGNVYYYSIEDDVPTLKKQIKTNKIKYSPRKQYGTGVSLNSNFICVGSPILGDFNIDEIITFGGNSVISFGTTSKMFLDYERIHPNYIKNLGKNSVGAVISYDHSSLRDNRCNYIGNVFYKNGIISITDRDGYLENIVKNSGTSGFELEFKSTHTIYENEIVCKVEPHEFNFSTNPTSLKEGKILFDVDEDGKFSINDATYIIKFILGSLKVESVDLSRHQEENLSMNISDNSENWPTQDIVMTENEDVLLMDLFLKSIEDPNKATHEKAILNLRKLYDEGYLDIDGDGVVSEKDAKLIIRYFMGRTGNSLVSNLVDKYSNAKRVSPSEIVKYLDEQTGKNLTRRIKEDFVNYDENDKNDVRGSYLAPYATTIGLYSGLDLVMVAKLGKPIKILPNYPINFLIKFDS